MIFGDSVNYSEVKGKKAASIVLRLVRKKKFYNSKYGALLAAWKEVVGPEIYKTTKIMSYREGKLKIGVSSPVLLHELKGFMRQSILEELKRTDGGQDIEDIVFLAG